MTAAITITSHTDLIEALPLLIGYQPAESLVALYLDPTTTPKAARLDLSLNPVDLAHILHTLTEQCRTTTSHQATDHQPAGQTGSQSASPAGSQAESVLLVAYSDNQATAVQTLLFITDNWNAAGTVLGMVAAAGPDSWAAINPTRPVDPMTDPMTGPGGWQPYRTAPASWLPRQSWPARSPNTTAAPTWPTPSPDPNPISRPGSPTWWPPSTPRWTPPR